MNKLPDKVSMLIRVALEDEQKAFNNPDKYEVNMDEEWYLTEGGVCKLCLAGAVMEFSLPAMENDPMYPSNYDRDTAAKLHLLDGLRSGYISGEWTGMKFASAVGYVNIDYHKVDSSGEFTQRELDRKVAITPYEDNRIEWQKDMLTLADRFEKIGL